jgi:hypothetical protein
MIHTYVGAPASILVTYFGTYLSIMDLWMMVCHSTPSCHTLPYTDCLSLPLLSSLQSDRVGPMWNLSYITLLYESLGSTLIRCRLSTASSSWAGLSTEVAAESV